MTYKLDKSKLHVIGLAGKAGAGKSTFAHMLLNQFLNLTDRKIGCTIVPFAKALKDLALSLGWDGVKDDRGRRLLQILGTDVCRNLLDQNYWVKRWLEAISRERVNGIQLIVADDVRFPNEVDCIVGLKGQVYKIVDRAYSGTPAHESEQDLEIPDENIITNNNTFEALNLRAQILIKKLVQWTY
jgi:hypothetical protein